MSETGYAIKGLDVIELKMLLFMKWVLILPWQKVTHGCYRHTWWTSKTVLQEQAANKPYEKQVRKINCYFIW
jgi:hypothetical protein